MPRESGIEDKARQLLEKSCGYQVIKLGREGLPDTLVLVAPAAHVFLEYKREAGASLTPAQKRRIPALRARGELVGIVHTAMEAVHAIEDARRYFEGQISRQGLHAAFKVGVCA